MDIIDTATSKVELSKDSVIDDIDKSILSIIEANNYDPFSVLGCHIEHDQDIGNTEAQNASVRVFLPQAEQVSIDQIDLKLNRIPNTDFFIGKTKDLNIPKYYQLNWLDKFGNKHLSYDPYTFPSSISDWDLHLHSEGRHWNAYQILGAHPITIADISGIRFAVWAPNAARVSVVGDFNSWDGRIHPMRVLGSSGIWEIFIPELPVGSLYKYELRTQDGNILLKTDPYAFAYQTRPETASIVVDSSAYQWHDADWLQQRTTRNWQQQPMSIYEVHLGSWLRDSEDNFLNYRALGKKLASYVTELGFTHIELLPITEHPLDASWGYQTTGYFAPSSRFGNPDDFRAFIDILHQADIGIILDWVPAHFPKDAFALAQFDGSALYEHADPRQSEHRDWGTLIFNYGRNEVKNFLLASALFWLGEYHIDALRVDAVASMLYLDYSKQPGDWIPNRYGGRENLDAVAFLQELNSITHERFPGSLMIAEESTAWPGVSRPTYLGGLGFSMKWNMGWMHDILSYMSKDPIYRHYHHDLLTFGLLYLFSENFVLPFSHDEVVHGKCSMLDKMPGDAWQKFASLRLLYTFMYAYPGKKLLFMGCEFAQGREWNSDVTLDWDLLDRVQHQGMQRLIQDLNRLYRNTQALYEQEFASTGFAWIDCHDSSQSILSFLRQDKSGQQAIIILNFTPVLREQYRIGVPKAGIYLEVLNSDAQCYWGSNQGNHGQVQTELKPWMGYEHSLVLNLPPLGGLILLQA